MTYTYIGDRHTDARLKGRQCTAIRNERGKCICGKLATMLVMFTNGEKHVVLRRQLRKK